MTEDPRVWCAAILTMLVVVLTASTGCTGLDYVPNHDIVVLKLTPDGSIEWTKVIDNGFDDEAEDVVEPRMERSRSPGRPRTHALAHLDLC